MATPFLTPPAWRRLLIAVVAALGAFLVLGFAVAQQPAQTNVHNVPFRSVTVPAPTFDLVQSLIDYGPGAKSGTSTTTAQNFLSVTEGELTAQVGDKTEVIAAGKGLAVPVGAALTLSNASSDKPARLFASTLTEVAAVDPVHSPSAAGVTVFGTARRTMSNAPATVDVIQWVVQYDPGFKTPNHTMNELHLFLMVSGSIDFGYLPSTVEHFIAGQQAVMTEKMPGWMANPTQQKASYAITWVATPGKPLTSAVQAAAPAPAAPNTGSGPMPDGIPTSAAAGGIFLMVIAASALAVRRRSSARH